MDSGRQIASVGYTAASDHLAEDGTREKLIAATSELWPPTFDQRWSQTQGGFDGQIFSITNFLQEVFSKNTFIMVGVLGGRHNERLVRIVLIDQDLGVECPDLSMLSTGLGTIHL